MLMHSSLISRRWRGRITILWSYASRIRRPLARGIADYVGSGPDGGRKTLASSRRCYGSPLGTPFTSRSNTLPKPLTDAQQVNRPGGLTPLIRKNTLCRQRRAARCRAERQILQRCICEVRSFQKRWRFEAELKQATESGRNFSKAINPQKATVLSFAPLLHRPAVVHSLPLTGQPFLEGKMKGLRRPLLPSAWKPKSSFPTALTSRKSRSYRF